VTRFLVDSEASRVSIEARSSLHPIRSETSGVKGWFEATFDAEGSLDPGADLGGHLQLSAESLSTGNGLYDREMRRRIDVRRYPMIAGDLLSITPTPTPGRYRVEGNVTFRGESRRASDEMAIGLGTGGEVRLEGEHTFDMRDFKMEPPKLLTLRVFPDVLVKVALVARAEPSA
jgi:polyisoprenoid-binding protein YceI